MRKFVSFVGAALVFAAALVGIASPAQATPFTGAGFYYATVSQTLVAPQDSDGISGSFYVVAPYVPTTVYGGVRDHSLIAEGACRDTTVTAGDCVEAGIAVAYDVWGDSHAHLYSCAWHNGSPVTGCYNGTGGPWVDDTGTSTNLGADLTSVLGTAKLIQVYHSDLDCGLSSNGWHVYYGTSPTPAHIGCWQPTAFTAGWSKAQYVLAFGEYAYNGANNPGTANDKPCGDMSDGFLQGSPATTGHPYVGSLSLVNSAATSYFSYGAITDSSAYNVSFASAANRTIYYGGPGYTSGGGLPGNAGSC